MKLQNKDSGTANPTLTSFLDGFCVVAVGGIRFPANI